jgi:hypothetical protein
MTIEIVIYNCVEKNPIAKDIKIGNININIKLIITLKLSKNIRKYNLVVVFRFNIAILEEDQIASKTFLFHKTISYLE